MTQKQDLQERKFFHQHLFQQKFLSPQNFFTQKSMFIHMFFPHQNIILLKKSQRKNVEKVGNIGQKQE